MIIKFLKESKSSEEIEKKNDSKNDKISLNRKNKMSSNKNENIENHDLFLNDVMNLNIDNLIDLSNYKESE